MVRGMSASRITKGMLYLSFRYQGFKYIKHLNLTLRSVQAIEYRLSLFEIIMLYLESSVIWPSPHKHQEVLLTLCNHVSGRGQWYLTTFYLQESLLARLAFLCAKVIYIRLGVSNSKTYMHTLHVGNIFISCLCITFNGIFNWNASI